MNRELRGFLIFLWCLILIVGNGRAALDFYQIGQSTSGLFEWSGYVMAAGFAVCMLAAMAALAWVPALWFLLGVAIAKLGGLVLLAAFLSERAALVFAVFAVIEILFTYLVLRLARTERAERKLKTLSQEF